MKNQFFLSVSVLAVSIGHGAVSHAQSCSPRASVSYETREVNTDGLVASFMQPNTPGPQPALVILGGSEGGTALVRTLAQPFAAQGYAVLALSYFGAPGLPSTAENIPLEYFDRAVAWLKKQPGVDGSRIGIYGVSKGGEAALLVGSRTEQLRAVAAGVGTHLVWQGITYVPGAAPQSTWSLNGKGITYMPYDPNVRFDFNRYIESINALYSGALAQDHLHPDAHIPVEQINGPIMLISGKEDALWPSSDMSERVVARLAQKKFKFSVQHLSYPDAGHAVAMPPSMPPVSGYPDEAIGGTAAGNQAGRADMWPRLICFFDKALDKEH